MPAPVAAVLRATDVGARGACPTVRRPLAAADGLLVRVRLADGVLTADQARSVAATAARWGNGVVELTSRANLQVRGVTADGLDAAAADLVAAGLAPSGPDDEVLADVLVPPTTGLTSSAGPDLRPLAADLRARLTTRALAGRRLHPKACVSLATAGSGADPVADVTLVATADGSPYAFHVAGADRSSPPPLLRPAEAVDATVAALALAGGAPDGPLRVRDLVTLLGTDAVLAHLGIRPTTDPSTTAAAAHTPTAAEPAASLGVLRTGGPAVAVAVAALPPLGRLTADGVHALADIVDRHGNGTLRITTRRAILVPPLSDRPAHDSPATSAAVDRAEALVDALAGLGFVVDAGDPAAGVVACAGLPGCTSGHADTQADGAIVMAALRTTDRSTAAARSTPTGTATPAAPAAAPTVHVSGCAKRCASRRPHDVTLIAEPGGYAVALADPLVAGGERLVAAGLPLAGALAAAGIPTTEGT